MDLFLNCLMALKRRFKQLYLFSSALTPASRVGWTATSNNFLVANGFDFTPSLVLDNITNDWMVLFVSANQDPLNWLQIDFGRVIYSIFRVDVYKRLQRLDRFQVEW